MVISNFGCLYKTSRFVYIFPIFLFLLCLASVETSAAAEFTRTWTSYNKTHTLPMETPFFGLPQNGKRNVGDVLGTFPAQTDVLIKRFDNHGVAEIANLNSGDNVYVSAFSFDKVLPNHKIYRFNADRVAEIINKGEYKQSSFMRFSAKAYTKPAMHYLKAATDAQSGFVFLVRGTPVEILYRNKNESGKPEYYYVRTPSGLEGVSSIGSNFEIDTTSIVEGTDTIQMSDLAVRSISLLQPYTKTRINAKTSIANVDLSVVAKTLDQATTKSPSQVTGKKSGPKLQIAMTVPPHLRKATEAVRPAPVRSTRRGDNNMNLDALLMSGEIELAHAENQIRREIAAEKRRAEEEIRRQRRQAERERKRINEELAEQREEMEEELRQERIRQRMREDSADDSNRRNVWNEYVAKSARESREFARQFQQTNDFIVRERQRAMAMKQQQHTQRQLQQFARQQQSQLTRQRTESQRRASQRQKDLEARLMKMEREANAKRAALQEKQSMITRCMNRGGRWTGRNCQIRAGVVQQRQDEQKDTSVSSSDESKTRKQEPIVVLNEMTAFCYQNNKQTGWFCDGPVQRTATTDTLSQSLEYVGCSTSRSGRKVRYKNGFIHFCNYGTKPLGNVSWSRDIVSILGVPSSYLAPRRRFYCRKADETKKCGPSLAIKIIGG
jgi:hypothetical protein